MPPDEEKRRKSIAYILRRRKRGRKVGANSGEVVKSWAEYSEVSFKPSGSYSEKWRWIMIPAWLAAASAPLLFFAAPQSGFQRHSENLAHSGLHPVGWALVAMALILAFVIFVFAAAYIGLAIWRFIRSFGSYKNE